MNCYYITKICPINMKDTKYAFFTEAKKREEMYIWYVWYAKFRSGSGRKQQGKSLQGGKDVRGVGVLVVGVG